MSNMWRSTHAPRRNQEWFPREVLSELESIEPCGGQMNRTEKEVAKCLGKGRMSTIEIHDKIKHKYFIGSIKELGQRISHSRYFSKVDKVKLTGENRYEVAVWEVKKT